MELTPSCPYCNCALILFEHYDCYDDANRALFFADGNCPKCHREYRWTDVYTLNCFEDLEEIKED